MAFPFSISDGKTKDQLKAADLQVLRQWFINDNLFVTQTDFNNDETAVQLAQIVRVLEQSVGNEPTIYDNGTSRSSATTSTNSLTLQVERALTQVLGRSPGRGTDGFVTALNSAFPTGKDGNVLATPARSIVSLYSPDAEGLSGQLSVEQANLYRQASIIGNDALKVLDGLQPFNPTADIDAVEALRALIRSQIRSLIDEFGRLDEPRKERVENFFSALGLPDNGRDSSLGGGSLLQLGRAMRLDGSNFGKFDFIPVTVDDETQVAGYQLLLNYVRTLQDSWRRFTPIPDNIEAKVAGGYSQRLSRVNIMLPVIADSNISFMSALDSVGFTQSERRSDAALFTTLELTTLTNFSQVTIDTNTSTGSITFSITLPDITVNDFDEWVDRFTTMEAPSLLSESGQFGLDFVTDQADTLFWTIAAVLYAITPNPNSEGNQSQQRNQAKLLGKVLSFERVKQTLSELIFQLDTLADLGVPVPLPPLTRVVETL
jgi:hypothetical protein